MKKEICKANTKMMGWRCSRPAIIEGYCKLHYDKMLREEGAIKAERLFRNEMTTLINRFHYNLVLNEDKEQMIEKVKEISVVDKSSR